MCPATGPVARRGNGTTHDAKANAIMKTKEERRTELKGFASLPNGINKLYWVLTQSFIPFDKLPIGTLMIEAILDHEYPPRQ